MLKKKTTRLSEFARLIVASNEFKSAQQQVDSLNKLTGRKNRLSFSIVENSSLDGDNPEIISVGFIDEESAFNRNTVYTMRYDKKAKKIISIVKSQKSN